MLLERRDGEVRARQDGVCAHFPSQRCLVEAREIQLQDGVLEERKGSLAPGNLSCDSILAPDGKDGLENARTANCGDAFEEVECVGGCGAGEGLDEDDAGGGLRARGVETLNAERHCGERVECLRKERV